MNIRWIIRDGEKVLQKETTVNIYDEQYVMVKTEWEDVPLHQEPEKTVAITKSQAIEIAKAGAWDDWTWDDEPTHTDKVGALLKKLGF